MSFIFERECGLKKASVSFIEQCISQPELYERFALDYMLEHHAGPVNDATFNENGQLLLSGSDDCHVNIWNVHGRNLKLSWQTMHTSNIFSVVFLPQTNDEIVLSAAGDGQVQIHNLVQGLTEIRTRHNDRVKVIKVHSEMPQTIFSCSEDKTIKAVDLREPESASLLKLRNPIYTFDICKTKPWLLAVGGSTEILKVFDRRKLQRNTDNPKSIWSVSMRDLNRRNSSEGITGVQFSADGNQILANFLGNYVYLLSVYNDEGKILSIHSQTGKKRAHSTPSNSSQGYLTYEDQYTDCLREAVKHLLQGNTRAATDVINQFLSFFECCWQMHYILTKCHMLEGNLQEAMKAVNKGIDHTQNSNLVELESEIIRLKSCSSSILRTNKTDVECLQMAEMVNILGLNYDVLFPDGVGNETDETGHLSTQSSVMLDVWTDFLPEDAETLLQVSTTPTSDLMDQDDASFYDWGWTASKHRQTEDEMSDSQEAMLTAIGKTVASGDIKTKDSALWDIRYRGHVHNSTIKAVSFLTPDESIVCAGSDDGRLFLWEKETGKILSTLRGDRFAVNGAINHPYDPLIASWGVDDTIKVWTPSLPKKPHRNRSFYTRLGRNEIVQENEAFFLHTFD